MICTKVCSLPQCQRQFRLKAKEVYKDECLPSGKKIALLMGIWDIITHWNYMHAMIEWALILHKVCSWLLSDS